MIVTGLVTFRNVGRVLERIDAEREAFRERFGFDLFLDPAKGYLEVSDLDALRTAGCSVRDDPYRRLANLRTMVDSSRPRYHYAFRDR